VILPVCVACIGCVAASRCVGGVVHAIDWGCARRVFCIIDHGVPRYRHGEDTVGSFGLNA
jgi:hypothetical protein